MWELAGAGWRKVLQQHRDAILEQHTGKLNTPRPVQIASLFEKLIGLRDVTRHWHWEHMSATRARSYLDAPVTRRGEIAHRVTAGIPVHKRDVVKASRFVRRVSVISSNLTSLFLSHTFGKLQWGGYTVR